MSRFTENPEGNGSLPFAIHTQEPLDLHYNPIEEIEIADGRIALHPEVIAAMPDTEHVTIADFNLAAFAALGVTTAQLCEIMPGKSLGSLDQQVGVVRALLGYPNRNALPQALFAHNIFETTQKGSFPDLKASEKTFLEWLATGKTIGKSAKAAGINEYRGGYILRTLRGEKTTPLAELLVAAEVAGKIAITRFYQPPNTV